MKANIKDGKREIWPLLIEKAYAKLYGAYPQIDGGYIDRALADMTNGWPSTYSLKDDKL